MAFLDSFLSGLSGDNFHYYDHASKTFLSNNYARVPKTKSWFHVFFEINNSAKNTTSQLVQNVFGSFSGSDKMIFNLDDSGKVAQLGLLVKSVKLPGIKFDTKKHNQYNKWTISVNKINYDPIDITFHDDSLHVMRNFWYTYYQYMNQDIHDVDFLESKNGIKIPSSLDPNTLYDKFNHETPQNWGTDTTENDTHAFNRIEPFFSAIRIYHFARAVNPQKGATYAEYVLVNPIITSFSHDTLEYSQSDFAQCQMSIEYETVIYSEGSANSEELPSWNYIKQTSFDISKSTLNNPTASLTGPGGVLNSAISVLDITSGSIPGSIVKTAQSVLAFKKVGANGLTNMVKTMGINTGTNIGQGIIVPKLQSVISTKNNPFIGG